MAAIDEEFVPIAARPAVPAGVPVPAQADSDTTLIRLWLDGKAPPTRRAYAADLAAFLGGLDLITAQSDSTQFALALRAARCLLTGPRFSLMTTSKHIPVVNYEAGFTTQTSSQAAKCCGPSSERPPSPCRKSPSWPAAASPWKDFRSHTE